jgi:hypothetical protein
VIVVPHVRDVDAPAAARDIPLDVVR